jgi:hypothetical protein
MRKISGIARGSANDLTLRPKAGMRKYRPFAEGATNGSIRPFAAL